MKCRSYCNEVAPTFIDSNHFARGLNRPDTNIRLLALRFFYGIYPVTQL